MNPQSKIKVDKFFYNELKRIMGLKPWHREAELVKFLNELDPIQQRTGQQNKALHKFFSMLSESLNLAGLEMKVILKAETEIWWTMESVKEYLWRPLQKMMYGKESTTELEKQVEIDKIHEQLMHLLGEKHGIEYIPFPSEPEKKEEIKEVEYPNLEEETGLKEGEPHPFDIGDERAIPE